MSELKSTSFQCAEEVYDTTIILSRKVLEIPTAGVPNIFKKGLNTYKEEHREKLMARVINAHNNGIRSFRKVVNEFVLFLDDTYTHFCNLQRRKQ